MKRHEISYSKLLWILLASLLVFGCQEAKKDKQVAVARPELVPPSRTYGDLLEAVQLKKVFEDGKTFVDCVPKEEVDKIVQEYEAEKNQQGFQLDSFVKEHFDLPVQYASGFKSDTTNTVEEHILTLWKVLRRDADSANIGTRIALPHPYIVPGGRFGEIYYWDSYFTMLGLEASGETALINDMVDNFAYMLNEFGFIPNGNRTYYLGRSQPPFFALMVELLAGIKGDSIYVQYLSYMEKEHAFWMNGQEQLQEDYTVYKRTVQLPDSSILNRYWDNLPGPRSEMYADDVETAKEAGRPTEVVYKHLRAGAESGWDFSSRWLADTTNLSTIHTTDIIPVDLNALLFKQEQIIAKAADLSGDQGKAEHYHQLAEDRKAAIQKYCWDEQTGFYRDYDFRAKHMTSILSLAGVYPLCFGIATPEQASEVATHIKKDFLKPGGVVTTLQNTGQQWDAPNGWAPLQWMTIWGLRNYGEIKLADEIEQRWVKLNTKIYRNTGKMVEKYNVEDISLEAGGGEYPVQDGFGWTNGVLIRLMREESVAKPE
ncbi:alpha,alpha-trehalase TreF [Limibacter armeniacum]|uniref:alpha,alpha-trehalase TreF n=1 Tax=Limibacter armeniacum TaxID=466084 RepID=UPI002FE5E2EA